MQIVCEKCGTTGAAAAVEIVGGNIVLRCATCGHGNTVQTSIAATEQPPPVVLARPPELAPSSDQTNPAPQRTAEALAAPANLPPIKCPKCGHRQYDEDSCEKCGLVYALVADGRRPWDEFPPEQALHLPEARRLWSLVQATPDHLPNHATFVAFCRENGLLTFAASRYRHHLADFPDDAVSQSYLERVVRDATALVQTLRPERDDFTAQLARLKTVLLVVVGFLCVLAVAIMLRMMMIRDPMLP